MMISFFYRVRMRVRRTAKNHAAANAARDGQRAMGKGGGLLLPARIDHLRSVPK